MKFAAEESKFRFGNLPFGHIGLRFETCLPDSKVLFSPSYLRWLLSVYLLSFTN